MLLAAALPRGNIPGGKSRLIEVIRILVLTGLTGMFTIIGRIRTNCKTGVKNSCQIVLKSKHRQELTTFAAVQPAKQDVQRMLSVLSARERFVEQNVQNPEHLPAVLGS